MAEMTKLLLYFLIGGVVVAFTTYYGTRGNGLAAAFISQFPSMTVLIFYLIYQSGGNDAVVSYAKGFLYVVPPWILYVAIVYFLCDRIGAVWSLSIGVTAYMLTSWLLAMMQSGSS